MKQCPECGSTGLYRHTKPVAASGAYGPNLLPGLQPSAFKGPKMFVELCGDCGRLALFADPDALERLTTSSDWQRHT